jgi:hypothetical protein
MASRKKNFNPYPANFNEIYTLPFVTRSFLQWPNFFGWTGQKVLAGPGSSVSAKMAVTHVLLKHQAGSARVLIRGG